MSRRAGPLRLVVLVVLACALVEPAAAQSPGSEGQLGGRCACKALDWSDPACCKGDLRCIVFGGLGLGTPPAVRGLCLPKQPASCGGEGSPCCLGPNVDGSLTASCSSGLSCVPPPLPWAGKAMYERLASGGAAALASTAVAGTCQRFSTAQCGKAYMPCGKDIAAAGVSCPGNPASCPSGFYCAAAADAGVGERCIPLPKNAGQAGGPCLPNNLPNAPVVASAQQAGAKIAPPFCSGPATCFAYVGEDAPSLTHSQPDKAKSVATRISSTLCVNVPANCGAGPGSPCCPSDFNSITDKPLPSAGTKWAGSPCDTTRAGRLYCSGSYAWLSQEPLGRCTANPPCGAEGQPCCWYTKAGSGGQACPGLRPGSGYCSLQSVCRVCPTTLYKIEELLRCY